MGTYERKTREIKRSLHRRARIRRAYFKMIGEDPKKKTHEQAARETLDAGEEIDLSDVSDSEEEGDEARTARAAPTKDAEKRREAEAEAEAPAEPKLTGRQLARRKRSEEYHRKKELEASVARARNRRDTHKHTMMKRNTRGQPKLGSQVGILLDKIKKTGA